LEKRLIGPEELAKYLDIKLNTVYSWVYLKKIPYLKVGRLVKFDLVEIDQWLNEKRVKEYVMED
jgi:excisionase family DNA binding protein